jgi:hypothetical protein
MMKRRVCKIFILIFVAILFGTAIIAAADKKEVSASATAERSSDGTIVTREATTSEINDLDNLHKKLKELDRKYPGPQIPKDSKYFKVTSVDNNGTISLEAGQKIQVEGIRCSSQGTYYIQKVLTGESDRVAFLASSSKKQNPVKAYVWHVDLSFMNDPKLKKYKMGPAYSPLNEVALTSGWCTPERSASNAYNDRYEALSKIAPNR